MLIKGEEKDRGLWKMGVVGKLIRGRDGVARGAKLRTGKGIIILKDLSNICIQWD